MPDKTLKNALGAYFGKQFHGIQNTNRDLFVTISGEKDLGGSVVFTKNMFLRLEHLGPKRHRQATKKYGVLRYRGSIQDLENGILDQEDNIAELLRLGPNLFRLTFLEHTPERVYVDGEALLVQRYNRFPEQINVYYV